MNMLKSTKPIVKRKGGYVFDVVQPLMSVDDSDDSSDEEYKQSQCSESDDEIDEYPLSLEAFLEGKQSGNINAVDNINSDVQRYHNTDSSQVLNQNSNFDLYSSVFAQSEGIDDPQGNRQSLEDELEQRLASANSLIPTLESELDQRLINKPILYESLHEELENRLNNTPLITENIPSLHADLEQKLNNTPSIQIPTTIFPNNFARAPGPSLLEDLDNCLLNSPSTNPTATLEQELQQRLDNQEFNQNLEFNHSLFGYEPNQPSPGFNVLPGRSTFDGNLGETGFGEREGEIFDFDHNPRSFGIPLNSELDCPQVTNNHSDIFNFDLDDKENNLGDKENDLDFEKYFDFNLG